MTESQHREWKAQWRDDYLKWICGFANADGGMLEIGRDDNGNVVGINNAPDLLETLPNKIRDLLGILVDVNLVQHQGKDTLEIVVEAYPYPISYKGAYHYRSGSTKQELKGTALDQFLLKKQGKRWDGVPVPKVGADDLSGEGFERFRMQAAKAGRVNTSVLEDDDASLLESLHLVDGDYLKRAAVLLFHSDPERFVTGSYVKIGYFGADDELRYQDEVHGPLFDQVIDTLDTLHSKYLKAAIRYEGVQRVEEYPYPLAALREALLNAIAHKDYSSGTPIQISVYESGIQFWNPGQLPDNWTVETLTRKHPSQPGNPDVANAFFRAGLIEAWGRGTLRIIEECVAAGLPEPVYRFELSGFLVELAARSAASEDDQAPGETLGKTLVKTPGKILELLSAEPHLSIPEIAARIDRSTSAVERAIRKLREQDELQRVGPAKGGYWKVIGGKK